MVFYLSWVNDSRRGVNPKCKSCICAKGRSNSVTFMGTHIENTCMT